MVIREEDEAHVALPAAGFAIAPLRKLPSVGPELP